MYVHTYVSGIKLVSLFLLLERRAAKEEMMSIPRSLKDARTHTDKGKPMKALPSRKSGKLKS